MKLCECGCGKEVKKEEHRFIYNHHNRGKTKENDERIRRMAEKKIGNIPWNKGLTKENNEVLRTISQKTKGRTKENNESKKRQSEKVTGRTKENNEGKRRGAEKMTGRPSQLRGRTKETYAYLKIIGEKTKGRIPWNKGLTKETSEGVNKQAEKMIGRTKENNESIRQMSEKLRGRISWQKGLTKETDESVRRRAEKMRGRTKENDEGKRRTSKKLKGRTKENDESRKRAGENISKSLKGRTKENDEGKRRLADSLTRKDITKEKVLKTVEKIVARYESKISKGDLSELLLKYLKCSSTPIRRVCGSMDTILDELNIEISRTKKWKQKENLGIELAKELYGEGKIRQYYTRIGFPDFIPDDITKPIIDIKSTLSDIRIEQKNKYEQIRKDVRFMVFEDIGKTELSEDRILYMKEIIKTLPNNKRLIFQERYEMIRNNIPITQLSLNNFLEVEK